MAPSWDVAVFRAIHHGWHHPALDPAMKALTDVGPWKLPLLALMAILILIMVVHTRRTTPHHAYTALTTSTR